MTSASGTFAFDLRPPATEAVERIVEELWQKGYDLKKAGMGWVVREPLGSGKIELDSDAALLDYVGGGGVAAPRADSVAAQSMAPAAARPAISPAAAAQAARIAASSSPLRQSSPPVGQAAHQPAPKPVLTSAPAGRYSLTQLAVDTWRETLPAGVRRLTTSALVALFALVVLGEGWRWLERSGWLENAAVRVDAVDSIADLQETSVAPMTPLAPVEASRSGSEVPGKPAQPGRQPGLAGYRSGAVTPVLSNAARFSDAQFSVMQAAVPRPTTTLEVLPVKASARRDPKDLTLFADQCAVRLMDRFSSGPLSLMVNAGSRQLASCYVIDGRTHCPYVAHGRVALNYLDTESAVATVYACDVDIAANAVGNLRQIEANPDIVGFLTGNGAS